MPRLPFSIDNEVRDVIPLRLLDAGAMRTSNVMHFLESIRRFAPELIETAVAGAAETHPSAKRLEALGEESHDPIGRRDVIEDGLDPRRLGRSLQRCRKAMPNRSRGARRFRQRQSS